MPAGCRGKLLRLLGAAQQGCSSSVMGKPFFKHRFSLIKLPKIKLYAVLLVTYYSISRREPPFLAFGLSLSSFLRVLTQELSLSKYGATRSWQPSGTNWKTTALATTSNSNCKS